MLLLPTQMPDELADLLYLGMTAAETELLNEDHTLEYRRGVYQTLERQKAKIEAFDLDRYEGAREAYQEILNYCVEFFETHGNCEAKQKALVHSVEYGSLATVEYPPMVSPNPAGLLLNRVELGPELEDGSMETLDVVITVRGKPVTIHVDASCDNIEIAAGPLELARDYENYDEFIENTESIVIEDE